MELERDLNISLDAEEVMNSDIESQKNYEQSQQFHENREQNQYEIQRLQEQRLSEIDDPRNEEGGGGGRGFLKEIKSAFTGGVQDTASSIITLPERAIDMFSGEMVEENKTDEGYDAETDNWFVNNENPIETKTWWGGAIRSLVHFGTMALAITGTAAVAAKTGLVTLPAGLLALASKPLVKGALIGAGSDLASKYSQEDNGLAILRDRFNFIDTPISTQDTDHPAMKTLKNVVEGMGIGVVFDMGAILIGKGRKVFKGKKVVGDGSSVELQKAIAREQNVRGQIVEKAQQEVITKNNKYGAYKNKDISSSYQAAPTSTGKAVDVYNQLKRTRKEWGAEVGSTDSLHTPIQLERTAISADMAEEEVARVLSDFMSDAKIKQEIQAAKAKGSTLSEIWGDAADMAKRIYEGRNTSELTTDEFWKEMFEGRTVIKEGQADELRIWDPEKIAAADLVIGSLMKEIRDIGIAGRELYGIADLKAAEGPTKAMYDKIIAGLTQIKLSKMKTSGQLRAFAAGKANLKQLHLEVDAQVAKTMEAYQIALDFAGNNKDDSLFKAIWETVSMSNEIHNLTDLDAWMRKKILGGEFNGKKKVGALTKELQGVMVNSVLSGPKTPMRAIMGTGSATFLRPVAQAFGAAITLDGQTLRTSLAEINGIVQAIPEAWSLFRSKLNAYWSGDISTIKNRFQEYTKGDEQWEMFGHWIETAEGVTEADKAAYYLANMARNANDNKWFTYSTKIMAATDDTFGYILARARAKSKAMREAFELQGKGRVTNIDPKTVSEFEDRFLKQLVDQDGNITDEALIFQKKEVTLTQDLKGFSKGLETVFNETPWAKPFFLFARTGVNGLKLTAKHTPLFNFLVKEFNDVVFATAADLPKLKKYGIESMSDLRSAKALYKGRVAMGSSVIFMASQHFMSGNLTGNGPTDRQKRRAWIDAGYKPRTITIGGVQVGYDAFEPFNLILSTVADIGDHSELMGEEWTKDNFQKLAVVLAQAVTSKSYLASMQDFVDLFAGKPGSWERIIAGLANNQVPLSSLRNELGKLINPYMKELNSGIFQSIRNRNLFFEGFDTDGGLPNKYDLLNGEPIKDWDFPTRMFNMFSPVSFNLKQGDGRNMLFNSGYDMRMSTYSSPDGIDLSSSPLLRSLFQKAIGDQNLEAELDNLAKDPKIIASINQMIYDRENGLRANDPMQSYYHNQVIHALFMQARKTAWAEVRNHPEALKLYQEDKKININSAKSFYSTQQYNTNSAASNNFLLPYR